MSCKFQMLAKDIIEDSLIFFLTEDAPNTETDGAPISQQVMFAQFIKAAFLDFLYVVLYAKELSLIFQSYEMCTFIAGPV